MWYWIIALIFFALEIAVIAVIWKAYDIKNECTTSIEDIFECLPVVLGLAAIGAFIWPLIATIFILIVLFDLFFRRTFNKIANWLADNL